MLDDDRTLRGPSRSSVLPAGMTLVGDVGGEDDLVVHGTVEGEVHIDGALVVEQEGSVRGNVQARTIAIRGLVVGDASATESIRVDEGGRMVGDVRAPRVNIVKGARFRGHVHMTGRGRGAPAEDPTSHNAVQATLSQRAPSARPHEPRGLRPQPPEPRAPEPRAPEPRSPGPRAQDRQARRTRRARKEDGQDASRTPVSEQPTSAGSVRALHERRTLAGDDLASLERKPPPPRIPTLRRARARRKDAG